MLLMEDPLGYIGNVKKSITNHEGGNHDSCSADMIAFALMRHIVAFHEEHGGIVMLTTKMSKGSPCILSHNKLGVVRCLFFARETFWQCGSHFEMRCTYQFPGCEDVINFKKTNPGLSHRECTPSQTGL